MEELKPELLRVYMEDLQPKIAKKNLLNTKKLQRFYERVWFEVAAYSLLLMVLHEIAIRLTKYLKNSGITPFN